MNGIRDTAGFSTRAIHAGYDAAQHRNALQTPIYATASYSFESAESIEQAFAGRSPAPIYSRISNPTVSVLERRLAALENGLGTVACSSGMAAVTTTALTLLSPGDRLVAGAGLFGGTVQLFDRVLSRYGVDVRYVDAGGPDAFEDALNDRTNMVFVEALSNPSLQVPEFRAINRMCGERGIPLVVDNTLLTPALFTPKDWGAAVVIHSTTKYITGSGSVIGGAIVDTGAFDWSRAASEVVREACAKAGPDFGFLAAARQEVFRNTGGSQSPFDAYLQLIGLETLELRMQRHCDVAAALAERLRASGVDTRYPGREAPYLNRGAGGLLAFTLGSEAEARRMINALRLAVPAANIGESRTLVIHPWSTIYRNVPDERKRSCGVTEDMVRVCTGLENPEDVVADFEHALSTV